MTAPIITTIYLAWTLLSGLARLDRVDPLPWAAVFAGLACGLFGVFYY